MFESGAGIATPGQSGSLGERQGETGRMLADSHRLGSNSSLRLEYPKTLADLLIQERIRSEQSAQVIVIVVMVI